MYLRGIETFVHYIGLAGSLALAISGALIALRHRLDMFGVLIIAFVSAVGGGTLRDMLVEGKQVFWMVDSSYAYSILLGTVITVLFRQRIDRFRRSLLVFDAIGLGLFTVTGVQIGLDAGFGWVSCLILGTITGSFGGVVRDTLVNEVPVIFKKEVYATISLLGGGLYMVMYYQGFNGLWMQLIPVLMMIIARLLVIRYKISLPSLYK